MIHQLPCSTILILFCLLLLANAIELSSVMSFRVLLVRSPFVVLLDKCNRKSEIARERETGEREQKTNLYAI